MRRTRPIDLFALVLSLGFGILVASCKDQSQSTESGGAAAKHSINTETLENLSRYEEPQTQEEADATGPKIDTTSADDDVNNVLPQCGILDFNDPKAKTFETKMSETYTRIIDAGVAIANVDITSALDLRGNLSEQTLDVSVTYANSSGTSALGPVTDVSLINTRAENLARKFRGPVTAYTAANNSVFSKEWKNIVCTIRASDKQLNLRSGYRTEAKFSPAFVPAISPIADKARYEKELGTYRFFSNLKATVTETNNPLLTFGKVYTGSMLVEKIESQRMTPAGLMKGDVAYRVTNRFGSKEETLALGFHLWTEYYIDHGQRAFSGIVTDVGDDDLRYFMGVYKGDTGSQVTASYTKDIKPLLTQHCTGCHNGSDSKRADLTTFSGAKGQGLALVGRVLGGSMPPTGALASKDKELFQAWSRSGFPEN